MIKESSAAARLKEKIEACYQNYYNEWVQRSPAELISRAEEIASVQRVRQELTGYISEDSAEYLLRFKDPLEVVSDKWEEMNGFGSVVDDDMDFILCGLRDSQDTEQTYELEPEFAAPAESPAPAQTQQMLM